VFNDDMAGISICRCEVTLIYFTRRRWFERCT